MAGEHAEQQPGAGTGVAEIEDPVGLGQTADADTTHLPDAVPVPFEIDAQGANGRGGREHVSASSNPVIRLAPTAMAPSSKARCDTDLSPGIHVVPRKTVRKRAAASSSLGRRSAIAARPIYGRICF